MYEELVKRLRAVADGGHDDKCDGCPYDEDYPCCVDCLDTMLKQAADAIEELSKVAKAMHTWIFLNSADEQAAYDECGLTDEMNAAFGYGGKVEIVTEPEKTANATTTYDLLYEEGGLGIR